MTGHFFATAWRNLARHKLYSLINIGGLAVGLACAIFILLFLRDELSYDRWIPGSADLYRLETIIAYPNRAPAPSSSAPMPAPLAMRDQVAGVTAMTRLVREAVTVAVGGRQFPETAEVVDPNFLQVIQLPLLEGNAATVFAQPDSVVLSRRMARKYFGDSDPLGKTITIESGPWGPCDPERGSCVSAHTLLVSGVLQDLPHNTQLVAELVFPNTSSADRLPQSLKQSWAGVICKAFVRLAPGADPQIVLARFRTVMDRSFDPGKEVGVHLRGSEFYQPQLTRFWDGHLTSDRYGGMRPAGSWDMVYGFAAILCLILLVACFNFTNLMTARAALRAREISLRKCAGATRRQLIAQFMGESLLTAMLALLVALALVEMLLPAYDGFLLRPITFQYRTGWPVMLAALAAAAAAGLLSGAYPALLLSGFAPAAVLRAHTQSRAGAGLMRPALVVAQFAISIGLGIAALVIFAQVDFARTMDLRFNRGAVVAFYAGDAMTASARESFARILRAHPGIAGVALSSFVPFGTGAITANAHIQGGPRNESIDVTYIDPEYPGLYGIRLLAGRMLSASRDTDRFAADGKGSNNGRNILVNATAARRFGLSPADAVGKTVVFVSNLPRIGTSPQQAASIAVRIAGVLDDVKNHGAKDTPRPMIYIDRPEDNTTFSVRLDSAGIAGTLAFIDKSWPDFAPTASLQRHFLQEDFDRLVQPDEKQGAIFAIFVGIPIFISSLGLFGLAAFAAERRTKEIGVRKVFGARARDVMRLMLWQFSIPVFLASLLAWPLAYYYLQRWLENYAYRIALSPFYFLAITGAALLIAWATVFGHTLLIARADPVAALRYE